MTKAKSYTKCLHANNGTHNDVMNVMSNYAKEKSVWLYVRNVHLTQISKFDGLIPLS